MKQPFHNFEEFIKACTDKQNVTSVGTTRKDASKYFNLETFETLLEFISNGGLEGLEFETSKIYENVPGLTVDSYEFKTSGKLGYIAISRNKKRKWLIKSFHLSKRSNTPFEGLLGNIDLKKISGEENEYG